MSDLLPCPECRTSFDVGPTYEGGMISYDCECGEGPENMSVTDADAREEWNKYCKWAGRMTNRDPESFEPRFSGE